MATIIVEDGSGLTTSNSYVTEAEVSTWATDRGITLTDSSTLSHFIRENVKKRKKDTKKSFPEKSVWDM